MSNSNNLEEFKIVKYKKKSSKTTKYRNNNPHDHNDVLIDKEVAIRRILEAKQDILTSDLYSSIVASLKEALQILSQPLIKEIVCFGLGKFGECMISRYQFALLLCLQDYFNVTVLAYDPIFSVTEHEVLEHFKIVKLGGNTEAKYRITESCTTIFLLPHCPKQLSNNLVWANWGLQLSRCVIIANSFNKILETNSKRIVADNAGYLLNISPHMTELAVINSFKYYDIFNDTAIHVFPFQKLSLISDDFWEDRDEPNYSLEDVEFITKVVNKMTTRTLRNIVSEMRRVSSGPLKENDAMRYILGQYHKFKTTDQQNCRAQEEMGYLARTYLCYLQSSRRQKEISAEFHGKGERTVAETAKMVGFKLPHDPK